MKGKYSGSDLALIVPTKDRPEKMRNLLDSLVCQTIGCARIIVVASGEDIGELVQSYADRLPVEYFFCDPPGQIRQRNLGLSKLDASTPLIGFIDDDVVFEPAAFAEIILAWNNSEENPAGVAFNAINYPSYAPKLIRRLFLIDTDEPGRVLKSGMSTPVVNLAKDIRSQWLPGGATVWRQDVIRQYRHREIQAKRAVSEDLIFSYPIGKDYPLYVAHKARCRHEHVFEDNLPSRAHRYYGRAHMLWMLYFVRQHEELSVLAYLWTSFGIITGDLMQWVFRGNSDRREKAVGEISGVFSGVLQLILGRDLLKILNEDSSGS